MIGIIFGAIEDFKSIFWISGLFFILLINFRHLIHASLSLIFPVEIYLQILKNIDLIPLWISSDFILVDILQRSSIWLAYMAVMGSESCLHKVVRSKIHFFLHLRGSVSTLSKRLL